MKKMFWAICLLFCFSCKKTNYEIQGLTSEQRRTMIEKAVYEKTALIIERGMLDVKNKEKEAYRIAVTEKLLFSNEDIKNGKIHLREVIAYDEATKVTSFGYILDTADTTVQSSSGNFKLAPGTGWGIYTGYLLMNDGCYHHGTFTWSGTPDNYLFIADNGTNNSGQSSTGFEDICLSDSEFESMC